MPEAETKAELTNGNRTFKEGKWSAPRRMIPLLLIAAIFAVTSACDHSKTIWSAETRSPDGSWLASARTVKNAGYGTAPVYTAVYLTRTNDSNPPAMIVSFLHDVSPDSRTRGTIHLTMKWETPSHLDMTYDGHADLGIQVAKYEGVEISVRDLSAVEARSPDGVWLASGRISRYFGAGTAGEVTDVYLERRNGLEAPKRVLGFRHDAAASRAGTINLRLNWETPSHLEVSYDGHARLDYHVDNYAGINISVGDLSTETVNSSR